MALSLVWKEAGIGSQAKLAQVKRESSKDGVVKNRKGIGHCGTLDPFAEGILCVGTGEGTKVLSALVGLSKTYEAEMILGATSETLDSESDFVFAENFDVSTVSEEQLTSFLESKIGVSEQIPPQHSAIKVAGKRAFDHARAGKAVELKARRIEITKAVHLGLVPLTLEGREVLSWKFEIEVSSGTYIRALARDWGHEITGFAGTLKALVRTKLGPWTLERQSTRQLQIEDFKSLLPTLEVDSIAANGLKFGRWTRPQDRCVSAARGFFVVSQSAPSEPLALTTPDLALQRVFTANPFQ